VTRRLGYSVPVAATEDELTGDSILSVGCPVAVDTSNSQVLLPFTW
jgi:hypothetical protein